MKQSMKSKGFERRLLLIMWGLFLSLSAFAQQISIKGHVVDATGEPVIGASVVEGRTTNGTITFPIKHFIFFRLFFSLQV